mmetsp:Transcript_20762/g.50783  ORF Transcript_20762/g.50783 Transcript_20762/m.50783 type:complete len:742 (-) Transcript_20762:135-2360(-)
MSSSNTAAARRTKQLLLQLNDELDEEKRKRLQLERKRIAQQQEIDELTRLVSSLRDGDKDRGGELSKLREAKLDLEARVRTLEVQLRAREDHGAEDKEVRKAELSKVRRTLQATKQSLADVREERDQMEAQLEQEKKARRKEADVHKAALDDMRAAWDKDAAQKKRLRAQCTEYADMVSKARTVENEQTTRLNRLQKELDELREAHTNDVDLIARYETELQQLRQLKQRQQWQSSQKAKEEEERARELESKLTMWMSKTRDKAATEEALTTEKRKLEAEMADMQAKFAKMQVQFDKEKELFAAEMERMQADADTKMKDRERRIKEAETRREKEQKMLRQLKLDSEEEGDRARTALKKQLQSLKHEFEDQEVRHKEALIDAEAAHKRERQALLDKLDVRERELRAMVAENDELTKVRLQLENSLRRLRQQEASVTDELELEREENQRKYELAHKRLTSNVAELEETRVELRKTEEEADRLTKELLRTKEALEETVDTLERTKTSLETKLATVTDELKTERDRRWALEEQVDKLEDELAQLKWYFLPGADQDATAADKKAKKPKDLDFLLEQRRKEELKEELARLRDHMSNPDDYKRKKVQELQAQLIDALEALPPSMKEPHAECLGSLMAAMDMLSYTLKTKMIISLVLTQAKVPPALVFELIEIAEVTLEKNQMSPFQTPEGIVMRIVREAYRKQRRGRRVDIADDLLEALVTERVQRTGKSEQVARYEILEAADSSDDDD